MDDGALPSNELRLRRWMMHHMCTNDASHDIHHVDAVVHLAKTIIACWTDTALRDAVIVTAMSHEVCDRKYTHHPGDALEMLDEAIATHTDYDERTRALALAVVPTISFSKRCHHGVPDFAREEERLVYLAVSDADYLESLGAIGVVRTCVYQSIHARATEKQVKPRGDIDHAIDYMLTHLVKTYDHLHFPLAKTEGGRRLRRLRRICAELRHERITSIATSSARQSRQSRILCDFFLVAICAWTLATWCVAWWDICAYYPIDGNNTPTSPHRRLL